jgi:hypothetical protein
MKSAPAIAIIAPENDHINANILANGTITMLPGSIL